jgi:hypothetical protein
MSAACLDLDRGHLADALTKFERRAAGGGDDARISFLP